MKACKGGPPWPPLSGELTMPTSTDFPYPRRYNSLRLRGFDYGSTSARYFVTIDSYATQLYWKRSREIVSSQMLALPQASGNKSSVEEARAVLPALMEWRAVLRPEVVELRNWPLLHPEQFLGKHLWHTKFNDHIIRNDDDLREIIKYIAFNPVKRGYVSKPQFYPFTGFGAADSNGA